MRALVILALAVPACLPPAPVYRVQRTVRVPHPAAPLRSGAPMDGPVELSVGASNALNVRSPRLVDPDASVEVPTTQMRGELRFRVPRNGEIALVHDQAVASTYHAIDPTQAPVDHDTAWSMGLAFRYAIHVDAAPELFVGLGLEILSWTLPYVEYRSCVRNCDGVPLQEKTSGTDTLGVLAYSVTPTYRSGPLTFYAGFYAAPHPTVRRKGQELFAEDYDSELEAGRYNFVLHAGAEYRVGPFAFLAQIQNDITRAPVWYGPSFGFAVAAHLPETHAHHHRHPSPPPPPPPQDVEPDDRPW